MAGSIYGKASVAHPAMEIKDFKRTFSTWMEQANRGQIAATGRVTLTASANATTVEDERAGPASFIGFMPTTSRAAQEWKNLVIAQGNGVFIISHTNNAFTDRSYVYSIMG